GDGLDELIAPVRRMGVEETDPEITLDGVQLAEEGGERGAAGGVNRCARIRALLPGIHAEKRRVLRDEIELLDAFLDELACLGDDTLNGAAAVAAANLRDDTEGAGVVTALGDLDVGKMLRRK